ncbi:MAG: hypothetical protein C0598_04770 [Marinilabiliales bacterium]|nr:MAG: hypothetical protein C0598_04770 [Marinilabiliales bacterium]
MKVIVDSGSTSTDWAFLKDEEIIHFKSPGFNPYYFKDEDYLNYLEDDKLSHIRFSQVEEIFFYGSGCSSTINCNLVKTALWEIFPNAQIHLHHDLYGAAVALCGNDAGIACILGTGSNSCSWDGEKIIENVPSLGYILTDEGSGTYLGKIILTEILLGNAPKNISDKFYQQYNTDFSKTLDLIYKTENPNKFISGLSKFAFENKDDIWVTSMIKQNFIDFIERQICKYKDYHSLTIHFVGTVGFEFKEILNEVMTQYKLNCGQILKSPMDNLISFHQKTTD